MYCFGPESNQQDHRGVNSIVFKDIKLFFKNLLLKYNVHLILLIIQKSHFLISHPPPPLPCLSEKCNGILEKGKTAFQPIREGFLI